MKWITGSPAVRETLRILLAVLAALLLGFIITCLVSKDPLNAYRAFLFGPLSRLNRIGDWLEESISLILLGLAVSIAFKAKQFSLGAEGQMAFGAMHPGLSLFLFLYRFFCGYRLHCLPLRWSASYGVLYLVI